jgi:hypothetical protein
MDFCISQKTGSNFELELHTIDGIEKLQKTNRFYASNTGGVLIKNDKYSERQIALYKDIHVSILNDYDAFDSFEDYDVDYSFYEEEAMKIVREIKPPQMSLFQDKTDWGRIKKMEAKNASFEIDAGHNTIGTLAKLGKNQRLEKIKDIVEKKEKIKKANPRYVYIKSFDPKTMDIEIYCLNKGVTATLKVDKKAYKKRRIQPEQIIYCEDFSKNASGDDVVTAYKIVDKIELERNILF